MSVIFDLLSQERESITLWGKSIVTNNDRNMTLTQLLAQLGNVTTYRTCPASNLPQVESALQKRNIKVGHIRVNGFRKGFAPKQSSVGA